MSERSPGKFSRRADGTALVAYTVMRNWDGEADDLNSLAHRFTSVYL